MCPVCVCSPCFYVHGASSATEMRNGAFYFLKGRSGTRKKGGSVMWQVRVDIASVLNTSNLILWNPNRRT